MTFMAINWANQRFQLSGQRKINPLFVNISPTPKHQRSTKKYRNIQRNINPLVDNISPTPRRYFRNTAFSDEKNWFKKFYFCNNAPMKAKIQKNDSTIVLPKSPVVWAQTDKTTLCQYFTNTTARGNSNLLLFIKKKDALKHSFSWKRLTTDVWAEIKIYSDVLHY